MQFYARSDPLLCEHALESYDSLIVVGFLMRLLNVSATRMSLWRAAAVFHLHKYGWEILLAFTWFNSILPEEAFLMNGHFHQLVP